MVQEGDEHNDSWAFKEKNVFCALCLQTLLVCLGFFFYLCDVFCKFSIQILTSRSPEKVFLKMVSELLIAKI